MGNPIVVEEQAISLTEMKKYLDKIKKRDEELNFRSGKTEEYLNEFAKLKQKEYSELMKKIEALSVPRLKGNHIIKIADLVPKTVEELKVIMTGFNLTITADNMKKIVGITKDYNKH